MKNHREPFRGKIDCKPAMLCAVPFRPVLYLLYSVLNYPSHFPLSQGTVCLDIKYVPPGGGDRKNEEQIDGDEADGDEDHDDDENQEDGDEHDRDEGEEKRIPKVRRIPRRRIARKWSDKIKDFQVT